MDYGCYCSIRYGFGLSNIRRVIYWGPPSNLEGYIQETGRAGRDRGTATAILFYSKLDIGCVYVEDTMKNYCKNRTTCRCTLLFIDFCGIDSATKPAAAGNVCCDLCGT